MVSGVLEAGVGAGRTGAAGMSALAEELQARYPVLSEVRLSASSDAPLEPIPPFLGLLLALAESDDERGCCLVLPDPAGIAPVFATLLALVRLRREFDALTQAYATRGIARGQRVKVNPSEHVYVYEGVFEDMPHLFKLRELDTADDARSLPVTEVLRLEPTERKRPKGKLNTDLRHQAHPPLDLLLGIESWGNESLYRNRVLFLSSQSGFERFLGDTVASSSVPSRCGVSGALADLLPWGSIDDAGELVSADSYQVAGEPLIAVTHSVDHLAGACSTQGDTADDPTTDVLLSGFATGGCVVVAEGTSRVLRNLQAFDEVEGARKVIVIAGSEERDALAVLEERGLNVWHVSPEEVLIASASSAARPGLTEDSPPHPESADSQEEGYCGPTLFGSLLSRAQNQSVFELASVTCADERLDLTADALVLAADSLEEQEGEDAALQGIRSLFSLLFRLADRVGPFGTDERQPLIGRVEDARQRIESRALWLPEDTVALSRDAADALVEALRDPALGNPKAEALADLLASGETGAATAQRTAVVTRYSSSREHVDRWLRGMGLTATICTDRLLPRSERFDDIAVLSWPGSARFGSLVGRYPAPRLSLTAYPFEQDWMRQFRRRMDRESKRAGLPGSLKAELLGLPLELLPTAPDEPEPAPGTGLDSPLSIFRVEDRVLRRRKGGEHTGGSAEDAVDARYLGFIGDTYAYLREGSALPVVTGLVQSAVDGTERRNRDVPRRTATELREGDFVLFREGSDHDVVRLFAEVIAGAEAYIELRSRATSWRPALQACAPNARRIHGRLREAGLVRSPVTVRNWLYDEDQIGPGDREDLHMIADVAGPLPYPVDEVWTAIEEVRRLHRTAGHRISDWLLQEVPRHVQRLLDGEARLDLDFGAFYVVEVEEIAPQPERVPGGVTNELLWDIH